MYKRQTRNLDLPLEAKLWDTEISNTLVVYDSSTANEENLKRIPNNVAIEKVTSDDPRLLSKLLAEKGCNRVLWECGPELATAAVKSGCIQEFITFLAPKILGGINGMNPFLDFDFKTMSEVINLNLKEIQLLNRDLYLKSFIK